MLHKRTKVPENVHCRQPLIHFLSRFLCHLSCVSLVGPVWERTLARPSGSISRWSCSRIWRGLQADPTNSDAIRQPVRRAYLSFSQHSRLQEISHHGAPGAGRYDVVVKPKVTALWLGSSLVQVETVFFCCALTIWTNMLILVVM